MMDREHHRIALPQRNHLHTRLHPGTLLRQNKLAAGKVAFRLGQQKRYLERKHVLSVEVLMQTVVVISAVLQK